MCARVCMRAHGVFLRLLVRRVTKTRRIVMSVFSVAHTESVGLSVRKRFESRNGYSSAIQLPAVKCSCTFTLHALANIPHQKIIL